MLKKIFLILISVLFFSETTFAAISSINGNWQGNSCRDYNDGSSYGTYNWHFIGNKVRTYIQYHKNRKCNQPANRAYQTHGIFKLSGHKLTVNFSHLSYPLIYNVQVSGNQMMLQKVNGSWGQRLTRMH
jgi:hypothetical protein